MSASSSSVPGRIWRCPPGGGEGRVSGLVPVYIAAGSNVEPERHLTQAVEALEQAFPGIRFSPWYQNRAAGFEGEDFINFAAGFMTQLPLQEVIRRLHLIEALCDRHRDAPRWAPRTMDLDLLLYGGQVSEVPPLPRPDLVKRAYMLGPLADLAPDLVHPTAQLTIRELWQRFDQRSHPLHRVEPPTRRRSGPHPQREPDR
jgi:2-amino-4-hydroxy-6-hydroxymethyldihydropteridine diphosphokinase